MTENNNHKNFLLKNALNNPPAEDVILDMDEPIEDASEEIPPEEESIEEETFEGFDDEPEQTEDVSGINEEDIGLEELSPDAISIEIPPEVLEIDTEELNNSLDYKRLEDRVTSMSTKMNKLQSAVESFNTTLGNLQEVLPQTLVKEADDRITKHLGNHIDESIRNNFGNLKEQLAHTVRILVAQGGVMNQCITSLCQYVNLLMIKNKITEMQLAMLKGKTFNDTSKKQLEAKLRAAHQSAKKLPLKGILQVANSLGDGKVNQPPIPQMPVGNNQ